MDSSQSVLSLSRSASSALTKSNRDNQAEPVLNLVLLCENTAYFQSIFLTLTSVGRPPLHPLFVSRPDWSIGFSSVRFVVKCGPLILIGWHNSRMTFSLCILALLPSNQAIISAGSWWSIRWRGLDLVFSSVLARYMHDATGSHPHPCIDFDLSSKVHYRTTSETSPWDSCVLLAKLASLHRDTDTKVRADKINIFLNWSSSSFLFDFVTEIITEESESACENRIDFVLLWVDPVEMKVFLNRLDDIEITFVVYFAPSKC